ncbi:GDSL esterase/lipase 7-like [Macadamia integrifolia]|uniref:GDSL esterase/lipase 7-like n=1 Tax=Macadamia integrifolia TaxID=60698 RepID=UPI001C529CC1|nr:GDSL esterase/lipase 7-like [Macadamia integrifolia]
MGKKGYSGACIGSVVFFCLAIVGSGLSPAATPAPAPAPGPVESNGGGPLIVPALYVFGDSLVDSGNNNYLSTMARANYLPYGVDFPGGPTGRFTNGKTVADFIAESLGLPLVPPDLSISQIKRNETTTGVNYASGSAGILPQTGTTLGSNLNLDSQISKFEDTVMRNLPHMFPSSKELSQYLSKSIFLVDVGSNDFINPYLQPQSTDLSIPNPQKNPQDFAKLLTSNLSDYLQRLYQLGARKFVVFEVGPIGCIPALTNNSKGLIGGCIQELNNPVTTYNQQLSSLLKFLNSKLKGSIFSQAKAYSLLMLETNKATKTGLSDVMKACCSGTLHCTASQPSCKNANQHFFFDGFHPTEAINSKVARAVFSDSSACSPISIQNMAKA